MYTEFSLPYGNTFLKASIPSENITCVLETRYIAGIENEYEAIEKSLRHPIASAPLTDLIKPGGEVVVLVTDNTRACPEDRLLPPILAELEQKADRDNITIIIALGLHPPLDKEAQIKKLGKEIVENYRVLNHDINDVINIGTTTRGTPVDINRRVIEADFRLSTGFIEPHFFAGFSGGRKSVAPGVFGVRSAYKNHGYEMLEHPNARTGILKGNPVHEDMVEQAKMAKLDFIVNVLLNKKGEITHVVAGDPYRAHEKGCEIEKELCSTRVNNPVDITITSNSGAPLDLDLYQTCKGIDTAAQVTRDKGIIIIASACNEGIGPEDFIKLHSSVSTPEEVIREVQRLAPVGVQWQNQILARTQLKNDIYLVSELEESLVRRMMMKPVATIEEGLEQALKIMGENASIAVIPEGPMVFPVLED
ncbi:nickel-dependent lactate racemase [Chloroflexota bacterium]